MSSSIIEIQTEDIVDNLNNILTNTELFRLNENLDYLKCFIFYLEDESISNYKKNFWIATMKTSLGKAIKYSKPSQDEFLSNEFFPLEKNFTL